METSTTQFIPPLVPRDSEGYVKTFTLSNCDHPEVDEAREFFDKFGFVVIANVFTAEQCADTISDIWNVIESFVGASIQNDERLWHAEYVLQHVFRSFFVNALYHCRNWKKTGLVQEGIIGHSSLWTRQILLNRQIPALHAAFAAILKTENLLVNHGRYGMFRPVKEHPERATMTNLHLDMNPWCYFEGLF